MANKTSNQYSITSRACFILGSFNPQGETAHTSSHVHSFVVPNNLHLSRNLTNLYSSGIIVQPTQGGKPWNLPYAILFNDPPPKKGRSNMIHHHQRWTISSPLWAAQTTKPCSLKRSGRSSNFGGFLGAAAAAAVQLGRKGLGGVGVEPPKGPSDDPFLTVKYC